MSVNNSVCSVCGKGYHLCVSCKEKIKVQPWKVVTDTSEHYKIFQIIRAYNTGIYTKDEAKEKLSHVDLNDMNTFIKSIKDKINEILTESIASNEISENAIVKTVSKTKVKSSKRKTESTKEISDNEINM